METNFYCGQCGKELRVGFTCLPLRYAREKCPGCGTDNRLSLNACFLSWFGFLCLLGMGLTLLLFPFSLAGIFTPFAFEPTAGAWQLLVMCLVYAVIICVLLVLTVAPLGAWLALRATEKSTSYFPLHHRAGFMLTVATGILVAANIAYLPVPTIIQEKRHDWICERTQAHLTYYPSARAYDEDAAEQHSVQAAPERSLEKPKPLMLTGIAERTIGPFQWRQVRPTQRLSAAKPWQWLALLIDNPHDPDLLATKASRNP